MTFADWLDETKWRFQNRPVREAASGSAQQLYAGALRRGYGAVKHAVEYRETPVWERDDWDVLCILDAARVDLFREVASESRYPWVNGDAVESITSVGSCSPEWISQTFRPEYHEQTQRAGYITGNPHTSKTEMPYPHLPVTEPDVVGYLDEAWRDGWQHGLDDGTQISTIPPETLTDRAIQTWRHRDAHGINRLIIHYMQPHAPFRSRPEWFGGHRDLDGFGEADKGNSGRDIWRRHRAGEIGRAELWDAYKDNLRWVLDDIERLRENCEATIALSSDHGNALGEWGVWSHPPETPVPAVRKVPWVTVPGNDEETVTPESTAEQSASADLSVEDRLEALGYK